MFAKRISSVGLIVSATLLFTLRLSAQPQPPEASADAVFVVGHGAAVMPLRGAVDIIAGEGSIIGEVIADKPYSAESITESTQILGDGNRITHTNRARLYRDSRGRTRREHLLDGIGAWQTAGDPVSMVMINDPVKDTSYFLDPQAQTAREIKPFRMETMPLPPEGVPPQGANVAVHRWISAAPADAGAAIETESYADDFQVDVGAEIGALTLPPMAVTRAMPSPPMVFGRFGSFPASAPEATTEDLGEQVLEGVLAHGTRHTQTIAAGAIGNELPIEIVHEQWYSKDIEAMVLRRNFDPRFGETTYRLINVDRSEPSPELFAIPQEYELQSEPNADVRARRLTGGPVSGVAGQRVERRMFLVRPDAQRTQGASSASE
jgi:hypothetical protein